MNTLGLRRPWKELSSRLLDNANFLSQNVRIMCDVTCDSHTFKNAHLWQLSIGKNYFQNRKEEIVVQDANRVQSDS